MLKEADRAFYYDGPSGLRAEKLVIGGPWWSEVDEARYTVDASFEVDTLNDRHEVHVFVGDRRVATSRRTGLGNGVSSGAIESVTSYHPDQVGTNTLLVKSTSSAQTVSRVVTEPFGLKTYGAPPRYLFTDQERDGETGLDDFGARTYDPLVGRFLEQDPALLGHEAGATFEQVEEDSRSLNAYAYVLNAPTTLIDPTGEEVAQPLPPDSSSVFAQSLSNALAAAEFQRMMPETAGNSEGVQVASLATSEAPVVQEASLGLGRLVFEAGKRWLQRQAAKAAARQAAKEAARRAAAAGSRYPKQVEQALKMTPEQLQKSIKSFTENIAKHQGYLKNPQSHVPNWNKLTPQHQQNLIRHWNNDIARAEAYRDIAQGVLGGMFR